MTTSEYNHCVRQYSDDVYRFVLKNNKHSEDARDIVQSAFEVLWTSRGDVSIDKAKSYLFTVAYRKMIDLLRKKEKMQYKEQIPEHLGGQTSTVTNGLRELLNNALEKLPAIQKQLVLLKDYEGYNYQELAQITSLTVEQVKVYLFRARQTLKKELISIDINL